jgi:hydroxyethylthiazole kinase-like uncharacterized protein yjeF
MANRLDQIVTVAQMRAAEQALIDAGSSVDALMHVAGRGAADYVWRIAARHPVTVLCGPGNNGGDGYVMAEAIRERGGQVTVLPAAEPKTEAARNARALYRGEVLGRDAEPHGEVFVDCLFGSGLTRPLSDAHVALVNRLAASHRHTVAVDLPSGVESDSGALLNRGLPVYDLTIALGAWKFAHFLMPACATMGALRLVDIGVAAMPQGAMALRRPRLAAPAADAHKYRRGLLAVVGGAMPGATLLACAAAQRAGAGYVKLLATGAPAVPADLVVDAAPLAEALADERIAALLAGPGLGRDEAARERLAMVLARPVPTVLDADALMILDRALLEGRAAPLVATPHAGELAKLEQAFGCVGIGSKPERAATLAQASGMTIVAKGPDTVIAAPDRRLACGPQVSSWLSAAGTGDVLAGLIASRLASDGEAFAAACEGVWLHGEAARLAGPGFTAGDLAEHVPTALAACL